MKISRGDPSLVPVAITPIQVLPVVPTLQDAIADCKLVIGASARSRTIPWSMLDSRQAGELVRTESERHPVALVFGREDRGLTNEELQQCHYHVYIPSDSDYGVLNVAAAIQVICYEVRMDPENPRQMPVRVRRMFNRMRLDRLEYNLWRGIFRQMQAMAAEIARASKT